MMTVYELVKSPFLMCAPGPSLCDGQWHSVVVEVKGQQVYLTVDNQKSVVMEITHLTNSLQRTTVIFGGTD